MATDNTSGDNSEAVRKQFIEVQKAKDLEQIGEGHVEGQRDPGFAAGLASAQEARKKRQDKAKASGNVVSAGDLETNVGATRPEPTTEAEAARLEKERSASTKVPGIGTRGRGSGTGILRPGLAPKAVKRKGNVNEGPAGDNTIKRLKKGMGIAGMEEDSGEVQTAHEIRLRNHKEGIATGKITADTQEPTVLSAAGSPEHRMVKVMSTLGVTESALKSDPFDTGMDTENRIDAIHKYVQAKRDTQAAPIEQEAQSGDLWEHPHTGELHRVEDNHPEMPKTFTRNRGQSFTYSRGKTGQLELNTPVYEGWNRESRSGGFKVWKKRSAPEGNLGNVVDYIRNAYKNPESANLKATGGKSFMHTLLDGMPTPYGKTKTTIPIFTATHTFVNDDNVKETRQFPIERWVPRKIAGPERGEGDQASSVSVAAESAGVRATGIPKANSGYSRVRRVAPRPADKNAGKKAADAKTAALFAGPDPEEAAGQMHLDFGNNVKFQRKATAAAPAAPSEPVHPVIQPQYDEKNELIEGTGTKGGLGYEQPVLPLYRDKSKQWDVLGGSNVITAAGDVGKTTSENR